MISKLVWETHFSYAHIGSSKVYKMLYTTFVWKNMRKDISLILSKCHNCQLCKYSNMSIDAPLNNILPTAPNQMISIDFVGPLPRAKGNLSHLFTVVDTFTKHLTVYAISKANTKTVINKLVNNYFVKHGIPEKVHTDQGSQFTSPIFISKMQSLGIKVLFSSVRHPQSNMVERYHKSLIQCLRIYVNEKHTLWVDYIEFIVNSLNRSIHEVTNFTPEYLQYGIKT